MAASDNKRVTWAASVCLTAAYLDCRAVNHSEADDPDTWRLCIAVFASRSDSHSFSVLLWVLFPRLNYIPLTACSSSIVPPANTVTVWVCSWAFIMMVFWLQGGRWSKLRNFTAALFFVLKDPFDFLFVIVNLCHQKPSVSRWTITLSSPQTHTSLIWLNLTHTPSCCHKYSPEHQMWINPLLKVVHSSCPASSCFTDICKKTQPCLQMLRRRLKQLHLAALVSGEV